MNTSPSIQNIGLALISFDKIMAKISKSATNPFFKNKYAPLPEILDAIKDPLLQSGLTVKQFPEGEHTITTLIIHPESGEWISSNYTMRPAKDDPQGEGSRITYQRRYALGACLGLNIDEDDDGNKASQPEKQPDQKTQEDIRPWLTDKHLESALFRMRAGELGEAKDYDEFVKKIYDAFKVNKTHRQKLAIEVETLKNGGL